MTAVCIAGLASAPAVAATPRAAAKALTVEDIGLSWSSLDPAQPGLGTLLSPVFSGTYDWLVDYNAQNKEVPGLATSWAWNASRTVFTLQIRKHVSFQDGTPLNAQAVVYNLQRAANPTNNTECLPYFANVTNITATGPYTVQMTFAHPYAAITSVLGGLPCSVIASPTAIQSGGSGNTAMATKMVGTGPYKFVSETLNSNIKYQYWPGSWEASPSHFSTITIEAATNDQSALDTLETGGAQVAIGADVQDGLQVAHSRSLHVGYYTPTGFVNIRLEIGKATSPFSNLIARRVLAEGIDTAAIAKGLYHNKVTPTQTYETPACACFKGYKVDGYPQYNPGQAAKDVASLPGGKLSFTMNLEAIPNYEDLAAVIQAQLQSIPGVTVTLNPVDETTLLAGFHSQSYVAGLTSSPVIPDPDLNYYKNFYSHSNNNQTGINDPAIDSLLIEARETVSGAQRTVLYLKAQKMLAKVLPQIPLYVTPVVVISSTKLKNFAPLLSSGYSVDQASL